MAEADLELINALQIAPRGSWVELGAILDVHPTTLARRWQRLVSAGLARVTIAPSDKLARTTDVAFVELTCQNNRVQLVADQLVQDPRLMTVQFIAGSAHLLLTVAAPAHSLSDFLLGTIGGMEHVLHYAVRSMTGQIYEATRWHFRALPAAQLRRLAQLSRAPSSSTGQEPSALDATNRAIMRALSIDGRAGFRAIARELDLPPVTVARRVNQLIAHDVVALRCDVARRGSGRSFSAILWGSLQPDLALAIDRSMTDRIPELRLMTMVTGHNNIHIVVWLNNPADLLSAEQKLLDNIPGLSIEDRRIVLRTFKYNGAVLDANGLFTQIVPMAY
nr:AsnC family transcriptional regulator [Arthrobacter pigmenti]